MKEHPILFNTEMVKALLDGRKTQTRRVIKPQPDTSDMKTYTALTGRTYDDRCATANHIDGKWYLCIPGMSLEVGRCPYGQVGDRLWVREMWGVGTRPCPVDGWYDGIEYKADEFYIDEIEDLPLYKVEVPEDICLDDYSGKWRPSIHMFRWASRINLEITDIRIERVQDITQEDAKAEGMTNDDDPHWRPSYSDPDSGGNPSYKNTFCCVWNSIYENWSVNPWVWVVEFKIVEADHGKK